MSVTALANGYSLADLRADAIAGLTVAIVALPLSMAIAIASGVGPERGLYTAIVGGFLVSLMGGSRYQIGGPAGAFIVLVAGTVMQIGLEGLILATFLSGIMLMLIGLLRLGDYIKFIPFPVTVGFTSGIAIIIATSQIADFFGLRLDQAAPPEFLHKLAVLWDARGTVDLTTLMVAAGTVALIQLLRRYRPGWPGMLIAIALGGVLAYAGVPLETIGDRFGDLPRSLPAPHLPDFALAAILEALPFAVAFTLLGAIESLLSAVVADGMSGQRHRSNAELLGQGVANIGSALFGGFCVTGTIARTATNVRAGSRGPVSGMLHAVFVALVLLVAAPLAVHIPLAALAGVLIVVAWNMFEKEEFLTLLRVSRADAAVLLITFLLVVFRDLTEGIIAGTALGGAVFIRRMSEAAKLEPITPPDAAPREQTENVVIYSLRGAYFFGAAATMGRVLDRISELPRMLILDLSRVPFVDTSGAQSMAGLARRLERQGGCLALVAATPEVAKVLRSQMGHGTSPKFFDRLEDALQESCARRQT
ncbi:STAS domain-containing protein [Roseibaca sp. Y0-43]|nr:SulP family inorganic anion transporter [Roseibaca sp. Y0-43]MCC1482651.1 STAS domain-containing protein [Roseibaca sp. Y0-43]